MLTKNKYKEYHETLTGQKVNTLLCNFFVLSPIDTAWLYKNTHLSFLLKRHTHKHTCSYPSHIRGYSPPAASKVQCCQCRPLPVSHRCNCLRLGDKCVFQPFCCCGDSRLQCPGELEPLHSCRVQCILGHPPAKRCEQGAIDFFEVCSQSFWTQYHLPAWQGALWHKQKHFFHISQNTLVFKNSCNIIIQSLIM